MVIVKDGALKLVRRTQQLNLAIDHFFESLAEERGSLAIGVILSGSGTDGTAGLRAIKAAGGLTFAQSEGSAKFDAMPRSAIRAGFVDAALPPREIAEEIQRVIDHPYIRRPTTKRKSPEARKKIYPEADDLGRIFSSLRKQTGVDFSSYKHATLLRRIQRRMALHRTEKLSQYPKFLRDNQQEIDDRAMKTGKPARKERVLVKFNDKTREVNIEVVPFKLSASAESWLLIIFDETTKGTRPGRLLEIMGKTTTQREISEMQRELSTSQSAGQELLSRNEELQLISEELETAKEELQSTNEELTTLNDELSNRNLEMMQLTSDLDNLLTSVQIPIVMVDRALMVRRATPAARNAFNILSTDIGRRITELRPNVDIPDLENILRGVIETLGTRERKVSDKEGRGYALRVRPYCNTDNKIDGAVITLVDLEGKKDSYVGKTPHRAKQDSPRK
jgi:hypothetical protein